MTSLKHIDQFAKLRRLAILALLTLAGCADIAAFRVIEYDASAVWGRAGGCAVHRSTEEGKEQFVLEYRGERCTVRAVAQ